MGRTDRRAIFAGLCAPAPAKDRSRSRASAVRLDRNRNRLSAAGRGLTPDVSMELSRAAKIISPQPGDYHGTEIFQKSIRRRRARDEKAQGRDAAKWPVRQESHE